MSEKKRLPFGIYRPDPPDFDSPDLAIMDGGVRLFGGVRVIPKSEQIDPSKPPAGGSSTDPVTGAVASLISEQRDVVILSPYEDNKNEDDTFTNEEDETEDDDGNRILYKSINSDQPVFTTYVKAEFIGVNKSYSAKIQAPEGVTIPTTAPWIIKGRFETIEVGNWEMFLYLMEGPNARATQFEVGSGDTSGEWSITLDQTQIDAITDPTNLELEVEVSLQQTTGGDPNIKIENPFSGVSWRQGGKTIPDQDEDWVEMVDDEDTTTGIKFRTTNGLIRGIGYNLTEPIPLVAATKVKVRVYHEEAQANKQTYVVAGDSAKALTNRPTPDWDEVEFTGTEINESDLSNIRIEYNTDRDGAPEDTASFRLYEVEIYSGQNPEGRIYWLQVQCSSGAAVSEDVIEVFTGKFTSLQKANAVGQLIDINTGLTQGGAWYFAQFGQNLVATNFNEEVQVIAPGDAAFSNLITEPSPAPKGRYVAQCHSHLILGDINYLGTVPGQANEVWWSGFNRPESFPVSKATGADRQPLYHTPGRVTGLVGGDACLAFKPGSIIRLDYVGGQLIFTVRILSVNIGTVYSKSIVQAGHDTYFFTGADFVRIRGYQQLEHIGDGIITRSLTDSLTSPLHVDPRSHANLSELENAIVGAYDEHTELVWWFYRSKDDPVGTGMYEHYRAIVYSIKEDAWSTMRVETDPVSHVISYPSFRDDIGTLHRGVRTINRLVPAGESYVAAFQQETSYKGKLGTKIFTSDVMAGEPYHNMQILGVRPIATPMNAIPNEMKITVYASEIPGEDQVFESTFARDRNTDGWFPFDISGEFIRFEFEVPEMYRQLIDIEGAEYLYTIRGLR